jgi:Mce-associated membrane protein
MADDAAAAGELVESDFAPTDPVQDVDDPDGSETPAARPRQRRMSPLRAATRVGVVYVVALAVLVGWLGFRTYQSHQAQQQRELFLQVGRQAALNLTTIDWQHADADIQRILNCATGTFYDDFSKRSQPFVDVVKQSKSTTVGTITEAGVESESANDAQVLVAVTVKTSNADAPQPDPRGWRMRLSVQKVGAEVKVSNVAFVP